MAFKINVAHNGKTWKAETDNESIIGYSIGETIDGSEISPELTGYELLITGTSDKAGFCGLKNIEGTGLKKLLLTYGTGMHTRPKREGKKERSNKNPKGLRLRKTIRGKEISLDTVQINAKVTKEGHKKFSDLPANVSEKKE